QGAGNGEVVHRRGQHQHVGGQQFVGQQVGTGGRGALDVALLLGGLHPATEQGGVQVRHRLDGQVADLHLILRVGLAPLGDEVAGQLAGNGTFLAGAAFDYEDTGHEADLHRVSGVDGDQVMVSL